MTDNEIASALLSDYHHVGKISTLAVSGSTGENWVRVCEVFDRFIVFLQMKNGRLRGFNAIESVKVRRLEWGSEKTK